MELPVATKSLFLCLENDDRRTPTLSLVQSLGISLASRCSLCNSSTESDPHLFFFCPFASSVCTWVLIGAGIKPPYQFSPSWIWHKLSSNCDRLACKGASSIFFSSVFAIWKCRNNHIFRDVRASQTKAKIYLSNLTSFLSL